MAIKERGYEISSNRRNNGVTGIAAPIFDSTGHVTASISVIGPTDRVLPKKKSIPSSLLLMDWASENKAPVSSVRSIGGRRMPPVTLMVVPLSVGVSSRITVRVESGCGELRTPREDA